MTSLQIALLINYIIAFSIIVYLVLRQTKRPEKIFAWSILLIIFPFGGVIIFSFFGAGIGMKSSSLIKKRALKNKQFEFLIKKQAVKLLENDEEYIKAKDEFRDLILFNLRNSNSIYTYDNSVEYFIDGKSMLASLKNDLKNAKISINIMFYIFANDTTGKEVRDILVQKAKEGVEVKVIYDAIGSIHTHKGYFKELIKAGGQVQEFFPPLFDIKFLNTKANYRNHRKIVVIDGSVGYTGGMNLRDDHMGRHKRIKPWRDTHLKLKGGVVATLQQLFLSDWRYVASNDDAPENYLTEKYFPFAENDGNVFMQVVASGPDSPIDNIKECFIKMMFMAQKRVRIQTPYFIPDETFMETIRIIALSGIKVELMIPKVADKKFVYYATLWYARQLAKYGVKIYGYNGFVHAKTMTIDDEITTVGSCNIDVRSFKLNFEVNAVIYDSEKTKEYNDIFDEDIKHSDIIDEYYFEEMVLFKKLMLPICRMFSSLL